MFIDRYINYGNKKNYEHTRFHALFELLKRGHLGENNKAYNASKQEVAELIINNKDNKNI